MTALYVSEFSFDTADTKKFMGLIEEYKAFALASGKCNRFECYRNINPSPVLCVLEYWDSFAAHTEINVQFMNESDVLYNMLQACIGKPVQKKYLLHK